MKESRSASQVLYGFLPDQTVDVNARVWRVKRWRYPRLERNVDLTTLREEICRLASPWRSAGTDNNYVTNLEGKGKLEVLSLDKSNGVELELFPSIWMCKACRRIHNTIDANCQCKTNAKKGQLPYVAYHDLCGALKQPYIPKCREHKQVMLVVPGSAALTEIQFVCPVCHQLLRQGFGFPNCECGRGRLSFNVHRAATVFTPRSVVIVNPPTPEKIKSINDAGGRPRALSWVVKGMIEDRLDDVSVTQDSLRQQLLAQGLGPDVVENMLAAASKDLKDDSSTRIKLPEDRRVAAEAQAVTIALATTTSRLRIQHLADNVDPMSELGLLYKDHYPLAMKKSGIHQVEFIDSFPILSGHYGYTRGSWRPGESQLVPYRERAGYRVYADIAETEALFIRLEPLQVIHWLQKQGHKIPDCKDDVEARITILREAIVPRPGEEVADKTIGSDLIKLIHSLCHKFIRSCAVWAGIDRNALSELLVPLHLGFYVYAAPKGDFVLGGLQAVFENELERLLHELTFTDHLCPLDPGCNQGGGACVACLHLGEPSCRYYNRYLSRSTLIGENGYFACAK